MCNFSGYDISQRPFCINFVCSLIQRSSEVLWTSRVWFYIRNTFQPENEITSISMRCSCIYNANCRKTISSNWSIWVPDYLNSQRQLIQVLLLPTRSHIIRNQEACSHSITTHLLGTVSTSYFLPYRAGEK